MKHLPPQYEPVDILISKDGTWHLSGAPVEPHRAFSKVDVVFNALHGEYGEDGQIQHILEHFRIPFTGSEQFASALAMNKPQTKDFLGKTVHIKEEDVPIKFARHKIIRKDDNDSLVELFRTFPHPAIVKPAALGSSVGVSVVKTFSDLKKAFEKVFEHTDTAVIEEFIKGREATCGVVENFRGESHYALLPIEIIPPSDAPFFDYKAKYGGQSLEICPGNFSKKEGDLLQKLAVFVHKTLGLRHYSRSDFIISPRRGIYFLEANTLPGLTEESLLPKALGAVGCGLPDFFDHLIQLALEKK